MEFTLVTIIVLVVVFIAGAFLGVLLGRRSTTANAYVNRIQAEADQWKEKARELEAKLRNKV